MSARAMDDTVVGGFGSIGELLVNVVVWAGIGFIILLLIMGGVQALLKKLGIEVDLVSIIIEPLQDFLSAVGSALAAPFQGLAKIFTKGVKGAAPLGTAWYYVEGVEGRPAVSERLPTPLFFGIGW